VPVKAISIGALIGVGTLVSMIVGGVFAFEGRYATHDEVDEVEQLAGSNTLLILYTQLDRLQAEARRFEASGRRPPDSLIAAIQRLCRQIRDAGGQC